MESPILCGRLKEQGQKMQSTNGGNLQPVFESCQTDGCLGYEISVVEMVLFVQASMLWR